jgi:hypothetical protein
MSALVHLETLAAKLEHLRHKGHILQLSLFVQRSQYLFLASDLDPISGSELHRSLCILDLFTHKSAARNSLSPQISSPPERCANLGNSGAGPEQWLGLQ